jgi:hypothetical protein
VSTEVQARGADDARSGEQTLRVLRAHWRHVAFPVVYTVIFGVLLQMIFFSMFDNFWGRALLAAVFMVGLALWSIVALVPFYQWFTKSYVLTSRRLIFRNGPFSERQIELVRMTLPELSRTKMDLLFGSGTLKLGDAYVLARIPHVKKIEQLLSALFLSKPKDLVELQGLLVRLGYLR